ncbi:Fe-S cluster assembly protein SufD [Marisediminicola sp. LYQ134]|uniref:Fe-S cluster assembly protein SufD n=1 Tax=Marisediminicola sp. LYQ134 TaxID=3391061 RepID=UPI003983CC56
MSLPATSPTDTAPSADDATITPPDGTPVQAGPVPRSDGGSSYVPVQTRSERFASTDVTRFETVTNRDVAWKFSPLDKLTGLTAGALDASDWPFDAVDVGSDVAIEWIGRNDDRIGSAGIPEDRAAANAWSTFGRALAVTIGGETPQSVTITRSELGSGARAAHTVITARPHSVGTVYFENTGSALLSENVEIVVGDGADLTVVSVQQWDDDAVHLASHFARVGRDARLRHIVVSLDGDVIRINPSVHLDAPGGDAELYGAYFSSAGQHIEQQVFVDHDAENTRSRVTYKGALQGTGARSVWIGDVLIRRSGVATDSYEQNRNLLLTDGARADSIPNLEIETGDIAGAGHASASGRFDDEQLFYLQARGISEDIARRLVVRGFLAEVVQKIPSPELEARLEAAIEAALVSEEAPRS